MMEIKKVYKTSKGLFWTKEEAEKNREKEYYINVFPESWYEPVREAYVLMTDVEVDAGVRGSGKISMVFELNPVEIQ
jgi:hypothetical protein